MRSSILTGNQVTRAFLVVLGLLLSAWSNAGARYPLAWMDMDRSMLQVAVDLASDTTTSPVQQSLDALYRELEGVDGEYTFAYELMTADADKEFATLIPSEGDRPIDYLIAARRSFARLKTAERAGQRDWISKHNTAVKKYLVLAAEALRRHATENENSATKLQTEHFAIRRPLEEAERVLERLKREGLSEEHRKLLTESGFALEKISAYQQRLQAMPAAEIGISMVELYRKIADVRHRLAALVEEFARGHRWVSGPLGQSFVVGNPHDRNEVVRLLVRRVAMPPEWTVALSEAESALGEKAAKRLKEVEKGKRYEVRLPAKGEIRLVSVVTPVGGVGENTTARWAIEGRIGEELLGGIVQEVNVPGFIADLQLPGIAPAVSQPAAPSASRGTLMLIVGAGLVLAIAIAVVVLRLRKRV